MSWDLSGEEMEGGGEVVVAEGKGGEREGGRVWDVEGRELGSA